MREAPTVLLLHGVEASRATWWRVGRDLSDLGWRVLALDLPGHGGRGSVPSWSAETLANDVLTQVHGQRIDLMVGHSLGAIVALTAVALRRGRVRGVALEDPPCRTGSKPGPDAVAAATARAREDPVGEAERLLAAHPLWAPEDARRAVESQRRVRADQIAAFVRDTAWDLPALVRASPVPVHVLASTAPDTALREPDRGALFEALPRERVSAIDGGHSLHRDRPALWLNAVLGFAATLGLQAAAPALA